MITHQFSWAYTLPENLARYTTNETCMELMLTRDKDNLARNLDIPANIWWGLAGKKLKVGTAEALCFRELDASQVKRMLEDIRESVLCTLMREHKLTDEQVDELLGRPKQYKYLTVAMSASSNLNLRQLETVLEKVEGWYWLQAVVAQDILPDEYVSQRLASLPSRGWERIIRYNPVDKLLNKRPKLAQMLLNDLATQYKTWSSVCLTGVLQSITQSRYWGADSYKTIQLMYGETPRFSQQRALIMAGIVGNPNTSREGVIWARGLLVAWRGKMAQGNLLSSVDIALQARKRAGGDRSEPVTGDWDEELSHMQSRTLRELRTGGILNYYQHPRDGIERSYDYTFTIKREYDRRTGKAPACMPNNWNERSEWQDKVPGIVAYIDNEMQNDPKSIWENLLTLSIAWEGTVDSLINAARTI